MSEWLTVKKVGRDDAQIARDAKKALAARKMKATKKSTVGETTAEQPALSVDDSSEEESTFFQQSAPSRKSKKPARTKKVLEEEEEDDDFIVNDDHISLASSSEEELPLKKQKLMEDDEEDEDDLISLRDSSDDESPQKPAKKKRPPPSRTISLLDDDDNSLDDDDDDIVVSSNYFKKRESIQLDDTPVLSKKKKSKKSATSVLENIDDMPSDQDERVALEYALQQSMEEQQLEDSDEQSDEEDDYVDQDAQTAGAVLQTANSLSASIIGVMNQWTSGEETSGMIVDGAVAMADVNETSQSWISKEEMEKICPKVKLAKYQLIGVNWLALLHDLKCDVNGRETKVNGVLADEMGLGKTCQTICFLAWLKSKATDTRPHLVVAPASVVSNWVLECEKFAPNLNVVKYHGTQAERAALQEELYLHLPGQEAKRKRFGVEPLDVVICPVTYFQKESSEDRSFLRKFKWNYMVIDEAHTLKNPKGQRYKNLDRFVTEHRLLLTGTPVQNSPKELMSLLCFLMPLFTGKSHGGFTDSNGNDGGERMLQHFVSIDGKEVTDHKAAYERLKQLFAPFVLRRRKDQVLNQIMPPKERSVEYVELSASSRTIYDSILKDHVKRKQEGDDISREHLFTQLRKAAQHPLLLRTRYCTESEKEHLVQYFYQYGAFRGDGCTKQMVADAIEGYNDFEIHLTAHDLISENKLRGTELDRYILNKEDLFASSKFVRLRQILPGMIQEGHRILIFSGWTTCLDLISCLMEEMDINYLRMDGSTKVADRQELIDEFTKDTSIPVFLLSTRACGLGINLTAADTCIMHDIDFNPFNDLQAEDRVHRIGQKKPVRVIRMVTKDTVDQDIHEMQQRKAKMNAAIMENGNTADLAEEKNFVLRTALDRYLRSPSAKGKENDSNRG